MTVHIWISKLCLSSLKGSEPVELKSKSAVQTHRPQRRSNMAAADRTKWHPCIVKGFACSLSLRVRPSSGITKSPVCPSINVWFSLSFRSRGGGGTELKCQFSKEVQLSAMCQSKDMTWRLKTISLKLYSVSYQTQV